MKLWTFEVAITSRWVDTSGLSPTKSTTSVGKTEYMAYVKLAGVMLHSKDVTREMSSGNPSRHEAVENEVMAEFAQMLQDRLLNPLIYFGGAPS